MGPVSALTQLRDAVEAELQSLEASIGLLGAAGREQELVEELRRLVEEIRSALRQDDSECFVFD